jgi:biotin synthase
MTENALTTEEILHLYRTLPTEELSAKAEEACRENYSGRVFLRGLIEFSNYCKKDCAYCGIRKSNLNVKRYRLSDGEIAESVSAGLQAGLKTFVLQSGEDAGNDVRSLCRLVGNLRNRFGNEFALTLSCGEMPKSDYLELKKSGADRYLMRFETSDPEIYSRLKNGEKLEARLNALRGLKELGFETGSGFMVGLPGETDRTRENNALLCKELGLDMVGIGPFIPHPETPLRDSRKENIDLAVRATALVRLLLPKANMPATTAAGSLDPEGREKMLKAGANVLMPNITPVNYKKDYLLYPGKICLDESGLDCLSCLSFRVKQTGKTVDLGIGNSLTFASPGKVVA